MSEFHAEAPQATASEELAQSPYVAAKAGFEPTTLRSTAIDSSNEPPRPHKRCVINVIISSKVRPFSLKTIILQFASLIISDFAENFIECALMH